MIGSRDSQFFHRVQLNGSFQLRLNILYIMLYVTQHHIILNVTYTYIQHYSTCYKFSYFQNSCNIFYFQKFCNYIKNISFKTQNKPILQNQSWLVLTLTGRPNASSHHPFVWSKKKKNDGHIPLGKHEMDYPIQKSKTLSHSRFPQTKHIIRIVQNSEITNV